MPRLVKEGEPLYQPHHCAATSRTDGDMIDFEAVVECTEPPHLYLKASVVKHAAKTLLKMADKEELDKLQWRIRELEEAIEQNIEEIETVERFKTLFAADPAVIARLEGESDPTPDPEEQHAAGSHA